MPPAVDYSRTYSSLDGDKMSVFSGPQRRGAMRLHRNKKKMEAKFRQEEYNKKKSDSVDNNKPDDIE